MADQTTLHKTRQRIGAERQPPHSDDLDELGDELVSLGLSHPFELSYEERLQLETNVAFAQGGLGPVAAMSEGQHLYRMSGVKGVARGITDLRLGGITTLDNDDVIWNAFNDLTDPFRWRSLSRYATGQLIGRRGVSWWTSLHLRPEDVVTGAYRMGMYDIWIPLYALLLRCPVEFLLSQGIPRVPTVLDAFDKEVFHPTRYADNPPSGITVSLEHAGTLGKGVSEFVLGPVEVDRIELLPVLITRGMRAGLNPVQQGAGGWDLLETYLNTL